MQLYPQVARNSFYLLGITQEKYDTLLEKYKRIQADVLIQMEEHSQADENNHIEAGKLLELAQKAYKLFEIRSSTKKATSILSTSEL